MEYKIEDIARFAEGDMEQQEKAAFEEALASSPALKSELEEYLHIHSTLKMRLSVDESRKRLEETLGEMNKRYFRKESLVIPLKRYLGWASAAAAVFVIFMLWAPWKKDLYQQYEAIEMPGIVERDGTVNKKAEEAEAAFNSRKFEKAVPLLKDISEAEPENAMYHFYYGVSLLETGHTEESRKAFDKVYNGESVFKYEAAFYTALSYLKENNKQACRQWLAKIPHEAANYEKAQSLLQKLWHNRP